MAELALSPTAVAEDSTNGGTVAWSNPSRATASDDLRATASNGGFGSALSRRLKASYDASALPADAVVVGVRAPLEHALIGGIVAWDEARLTLSGTPSGDDKGTGTWPSAGPEGDTVTTFGGSADLWGLGSGGSLSRAEALTLGLAVAVSLGTLGGAGIDHLPLVLVYETTGGVALTGEASSAGEATVTVDHVVDLAGSAAAAGALTASAAHVVELSGEASSSGSLSVGPAVSVELSGEASSSGSLEHTAAAAVSLSGSAASAGEITVSAAAVVALHGQATSSGEAAAVGPAGGPPRLVLGFGWL